MPPSPDLLASSAARLLPLKLPPLTTPSALLLAAAAVAPKTKDRTFSTGMAEEAKGAAGGVSGRIMPHLLNMYGSRATARDFGIYAPHATFEDPLMRAHGVQQIKSAFYTLPKLFAESRIVEYTVRENATGPGKSQILIDNKQHYKVLGRAVDLASLITLELEDGKVVRHQDWWDRQPLKNRDTVGFPVAGRLAEAGRRGAMLLTHALMRFGKDPPAPPP